ncbi:MAG TPA: hypothetical protein VFQ68_39155 [Streptosporangiaceae bacterium]|nr:hypothetical protein [Streptosporangiaceae bacterium]
MNTDLSREDRFEERLLTAILDDFDQLAAPAAQPRRARPSRRRRAAVTLAAGAAAAGIAAASIYRRPPVTMINLPRGVTPRFPAGSAPHWRVGGFRNVARGTRDSQVAADAPPL